VVVEIKVSSLTTLAIPSEDKPPSLVHSDAVQALELPAQFLEMVTGRNAQILVAGRIADHLQLAKEPVREIRRNRRPPHIFHEEIVQPAIPEANDHDFDLS
jgi:hypothetical protein